MDKTEMQTYLESHLPLWYDLTAAEQEELLENTSMRSYHKGESVHRAEEHCLGVLLLYRGLLRTYMLSEEGKEITLYRIPKDDICILSASCVLSHITFDVHVDAEEDSQILLIGAPYFSRLTAQNIHAECFAYQQATNRFSDVMWTMQQILFMGMDRRLAVFLLDELAKTSGNRIAMTHEQIAKYMGSAREVVTRMLKYFASEGIVALSRGGVTVIDKQKLRALL